MASLYTNKFEESKLSGLFPLKLTSPFEDAYRFVKVCPKKEKLNPIGIDQ